MIGGLNLTKVKLYARTSRDDQNCENQKMILEKWAEKEDIKEYDYLWEKMTTRKTRPVKNSIILEARKGHVDTIVIVRIDRWARDLRELLLHTNVFLDRFQCDVVGP